MPGVIRCNVPVQTIPLSFEDLDQQARTLIADAHRRAAAETENARWASAADIEKRRDEGFRSGQEAGRAAGLAEIHAKAEQVAAATLEQERANLAALVAMCESTISDFETRRHSLHAAAEQGLIRLAIAIARRVCELHVAADQDAAVPIARRLIDMIRHSADAELHVNPADYPALKDVVTRDVQKNTRTHVHVIADDSVARGGSVLRSVDGTIDGSIGTQIDRIARTLLGDSLEESPTESPATDEAAQ